MGNDTKYVEAIKTALLDGENHSRRKAEKLASTFGITDKTKIKELTELAVVLAAREIALDKNVGTSAKYWQIVDLYKRQAILSFRTSQSILLQQYSTPAPIGFLACVFVIDQPIFKNGFGLLFEPSAGNGLLTVGIGQKKVVVNELDQTRNDNLRKQGFKEVHQVDATLPFHKSIDSAFYHYFDAVITNPPFGKLDDKVDFNGYPIDTLDHLMAIRALDTMADNGKAAIIIGGHTKWDAKGRIQAGKNRIFYSYLHRFYHVVDSININGKLYSRQGTGFNVRLILIDKRKDNPDGHPPLYNAERDKTVDTFEELYERISRYYSWNNKKNMDIKKAKAKGAALKLKLSLLNIEGAGLNGKVVHPEYNNLEVLDSFQKGDTQYKKERWLNMVQYYNKLEHEGTWHEIDGRTYNDAKAGLGAPYIPLSPACFTLDVSVSDSMDYQMHHALEMVKNKVGGSFIDYVGDRLGYASKAELCKALAAEQIDSVALAIYNIEAKGQALIIGDQTGIGKGRQAAAMIRYGHKQGFIPVFLTEKPNLFSDIYRDLVAIGSADLVPFIINTRASKTDIKDEEGNVVHRALHKTAQDDVFLSGVLPSEYQYVVGTYSQFNSPEKRTVKPQFLASIIKKAIIILDESHNASGSSNTGEYLQGIVKESIGATFLSATFAKRPDNMPIYASKTAMMDANMSKTDLVDAILRGGVALQEVLSSQLVGEGQMIRRERTFVGIEVNYINLTEYSNEHRRIANQITEILRDIIAFQSDFIKPEIDHLDDIAIAEGLEVVGRDGTNKAGIDNPPYFSKVFNVINQMLFSIKAEAVADRAIERLNEGKKPVIAFANTMGSFLQDIVSESLVSTGDTIDADFSLVLEKGLETVMKYTSKDYAGNGTHKTIPLTDLHPDARAAYHDILDKIKRVSTGISISPIDVIIRKITKAGYTIAEVTGRKYELQLDKNYTTGVLMNRQKVNTNDAFRQFNNNEADVLMINQSGSTGASAHAIPTNMVSLAQVKQRVMIVLQPELDINREVQKRGRINRTGQVLKPIYDYLTSDIPAEMRLMMMLQKKLKSLDANTTSNQKQSKKLLDVPDFLNKYGDKVVLDYMTENSELNKKLDDPLKLNAPESEKIIDGAAHKVSGRVAVLSTKEQEDFYNDISELYDGLIDLLKQQGQYDLEVEAMDLDAEIQNMDTVIVGKGGFSSFGSDTVLEKVSANVLKKPYSKAELEELLRENIKNGDPFVMQRQLVDEFEEFVSKRINLELNEADKKYDGLISRITKEKAYLKLASDPMAALQYENQRKQELEEARTNTKSKIQTTWENRRSYLSNIFDFFFIGKTVKYPRWSFNEGRIDIPGIFIGYDINRKAKNPFAPSNIKLKFAIADSTRLLVIPCSMSDEVTPIQGSSYATPSVTYDKSLIFQDWDSLIKEANQNRRTRYIVSGNILQAFKEYDGKLISYTTINKKVQKGILMPENWEPTGTINSMVVLPIASASPIITSLRSGIFVNTNIGASFTRRIDGDYILYAPSSRKKGGGIYLDADILSLVENNNFEKISDKMTAIIPEGNIDKVIDILQKKLSASVSLSYPQYDLIKDNLPKVVDTKEKPVKPPKKLPAGADTDKNSGTRSARMKLAQAKAKALALKLKLLTLDGLNGKGWPKYPLSLWMSINDGNLSKRHCIEDMITNQIKNKGIVDGGGMSLNPKNPQMDVVLLTNNKNLNAVKELAKKAAKAQGYKRAEFTVFDLENNSKITYQKTLKL